MTNYKVGDIITPQLQHKNKWEIVKLNGNIAKLKSLISERQIIVNFRNNFIDLNPFNDGRVYDFDKDKILPKPYGKPIETVDDLISASAYYGLKDI
jgi:disulfide oxidoreductase YuzD